MLNSFLKIFLFNLLLLCLPTRLFSAVVINEVMYDLPGSDEQREWIEIFNSGKEPVNLAGWNIQTDANHRPLTLLSGTFELLPGGFALIVQDSKGFLGDWPGFSGTFLKSAFSLKNQSGTIILKNGQESVDQVVYNSKWGGQGDGSTLQRFGNVWLSALSTPGKQNLMTPIIFRKQSELAQPAKPPKPSVEISEQNKNNTEEPILIPEKAAYNPTPVLKASVKGAEAISVQNSETGGLLKWLLILSGLMAVAVLSVFVSPKKEPVDEIKIIE